MSSQTNHLKEKFQEGFEKARKEMEEVKSTAENSLKKSRTWLDDTIEISNEALAEFIAKVTDKKEEVDTGLEDYQEHNFNLPLADHELL